MKDAPVQFNDVSTEFMKDYVGKHGYWFASNSKQEELAESSSELVRLSDVLESMGLSGYATGFYVPTYFTHMTKKDDLPVWVWRLCNFEFEPIKKGDFCYWEPPKYPMMSILVRILEVKEDKYEISAVHSGTTMWVAKDQVFKTR